MPKLNQRETELLSEIARLRRNQERESTTEYGAAPLSALILTDGVTAPTAVSGQALIYVDTADGDLKVRFGDGTTKTIATDT